jgi:hypothetical protein
VAVAQQIIIAEKGGWDHYHKQFAEEVIEAFLTKFMTQYNEEQAKELQKAAFRVVK